MANEMKIWVRNDVILRKAGVQMWQILTPLFALPAQIVHDSVTRQGGFLIPFLAPSLPHSFKQIFLEYLFYLFDCARS